MGTDLSYFSGHVVELLESHFWTKLKLCGQWPLNIPVHELHRTASGLVFAHKQGTKHLISILLLAQNISTLLDI